MAPEIISYLYLFVDAEYPAFKVGVSSNPSKRMLSIPENIDLDKSLQFSCRKADVFKIEKTIHFLFNQERFEKPTGDGHTEWFRISAFAKVLAFVIENRDKLKWISYGQIPAAIEKARIVEPGPMGQEPDHIKLYINDIDRMMGLQDGHRSILLYVVASVSYDGVLSMTGYKKARIASTLGCSKRSIDNAISEFVKQGILLRIARGEYELDPHLFAKGRWVDIRQRRLEFCAKITYAPKKGRTIETEVIDSTTQAGTQAQTSPIDL